MHIQMLGISPDLTRWSLCFVLSLMTVVIMLVAAWAAYCGGGDGAGGTILCVGNDTYCTTGRNSGSDGAGGTLYVRFW